MRPLRVREDAEHVPMGVAARDRIGVPAGHNVQEARRCDPSVLVGNSDSNILVMQPAQDW